MTFLMADKRKSEEAADRKTANLYILSRENPELRGQSVRSWNVCR